MILFFFRSGGISLQKLNLYILQPHMNQSGSSTITQVFIAVSFGMRADAALVCVFPHLRVDSHMLMEGSPY